MYSIPASLLKLCQLLCQQNWRQIKQNQQACQSIFSKLADELEWDNLSIETLHGGETERVELTAKQTSESGYKAKVLRIKTEGGIARVSLQFFAADASKQAIEQWRLMRFWLNRMSNAQQRKIPLKTKKHLNLTSTPSLLVDEYGFICARNQACETFENWQLQQPLLLDNLSKQSELIRKLTQGGDESIHEKCTAQNLDYALDINPIGDGLFVVFLQHKPTINETEIKALRSTFGLSQREASLSVHMASGLTANQIADRFEVSIETIRSQLKSTYSKIGVNNQLALVAAISNWLTARKYSQELSLVMGHAA